MTNYLALMRKQDFADLYKYGIFHVNRDMIRKFDCSIEDLKNNPEFFREILILANAFDSSFTYVFVHYSKKFDNSFFENIEVEDVQNIYPLDDEAKTEQKISPIDRRIPIQDPLCPEVIFEYRKSKTYDDCVRGTRNIWKVFGLSDAQYDYSKKMIPDTCIKEVIDQSYRGKRPKGELSIWIYLLRYERHAIYPHTTLGYFMDAIHVIVNKMNGGDVDSYEPTCIYKLLDSLDYNLKSDKIQEIINSSKEAEGIRNVIKKYCPKVDYLKVATIFLKMKDDYADGLTYCKKTIDNYMKAWPDEFPVAAYLLGWILGHRKTYDCLYDLLPLPLFKKNVTFILCVDEKLKNNDIKSLECGLFQEKKQSVKIKMGKKKKNGEIAKSPKPIFVTSLEEFEKRKAEGWVEIKEKYLSGSR